jgi:hypothetical protein
VARWKIIVTNMIQGHIDLPDLTAELNALQFSDYFQCYQQTPEVEKYYNQYNSSIWQMLEDCPDWVNDLSKQVPQDFEHYVVSVINILPGNTIPYHADKHYLLQKEHGAGDTYRYLIFLEDWQSGHYFEIYNQPLVSWRRGDWIKFHRNEWHLAGNMGTTPFFSAQVTVK